MEKQTVFIKRYPSRGELPKTAGYYDTNVGRVFCVNEIFDRPKKYYPSWWLEEIALPSEEDVNRFWCQKFKKGAMFILNKLKT